MARVGSGGATLTDPLVSVMMPCYDSADTLPRALASLLAQEYENWECVLVDDGSHDRPEEVVERAGDPRIRFVRLGHNQGRPVARQVALDHARGPLLCMLDADDWVYPWKLGLQVEVLTRDRDLALVSSGFAIVDEENELVACRHSGRLPGEVEVRGPHEGVHPPRIPHGPAMLWTADAVATGYDLRLERAQDADFLQRLLNGRMYGVWGAPLYAYAEHRSYSWGTMKAAFRCRRLMYRKHADQHPISSRLGIGRDYVKLALYGAAFVIGAEDRLLAGRSHPPTQEEQRRFGQARRIVDERMARLVD